ncbi:hypothetical protein BZB76_1939 [Actinomadura pelletieri DSM 43383]|uniref:Glycosyl hydrolase family 26 n=1 Tax=Actinomadura pelletieri DSM 43383 TaxID=1120940 RepID=A0A495QT04_9ACTN|nr:hypothetical protein [Actinomadura pelletieri]RKS76583.1 hypothetical protein BZB76_1939 [Actinomadura pelletieri DSM 43383]
MDLRDMRFRFSAVGAAIVLVTGFLVVTRADPSDHVRDWVPPASPGVPAPDPGRTRRVALNSEPADYTRLKELGYDVVDVEADASLIAGVPQGMQAMLWVGNFHCGAFHLDMEAFRRAVDRFGRNEKVYGWYLSDEPNTGECPEVVDEIRNRAEYIRRHAPGQVSYIALTDWPMRSLTPQRVSVDLVGLDPYPCKGSPTPLDDCDIRAVDRMVRMVDDAGIPRGKVAPVLQTFGQDCSTGDKQYWLPTEGQFREILARWDRLVPTPRLEVTYSWGHQDEWACPTLADATGGDHPDLQSIIRSRYAGR